MPEETAEQKAAREASEAATSKGKGKEEGEKVTLEPEQYNALLDRLQELEGEVATRGKGRVKTVDELAEDLEEDPNRGRRQERGIDPSKIDELSNTQLARLILAEVQQNVAMPLLTKLEEFRVKDEIKELRKELKESGDEDDFDDLKEEIYKVASKNPNLSIKQAYKLAKKEKPAKGKDEGEDGELEGRPTKREALLHLPPRVHSTRPTHARGATDKGAPETRAEAAERAYDDMEKQGLLK